MPSAITAILTACIVLLIGTLPGCQAPRADRQTAVPDAVFEAYMVGRHVLPEPVETAARAYGRAELRGNTLTVHGWFENLSSQLRDREETPGDPGIHIHPGGANETNPYLFGLQAELDDDGRSGRMHGTFELTGEQVDALHEGRLYMDIHTVAHDPGEVRDQLLPQNVDRDEARQQTRSAAPRQGPCHGPCPQQARAALP